MSSNSKTDGKSGMAYDGGRNLPVMNVKTPMPKVKPPKQPDNKKG